MSLALTWPLSILPLFPYLDGRWCLSVLCFVLGGYSPW